MMPFEFFALQLSKHDLRELQRSHMTRYLIESHLRREQGLESAPYPSLLKKLEEMLGMSDAEAQRLLQQTEHELWEFSWFHYTDEYAWFRARKDVRKELGARLEHMRPGAVDEMVEQRYQDKFEKYVSEIDMKEDHVEQKKERKRK